MRRIKYNRADINSTMTVADGIAQRNNLIMYVFATAYGYTIEQRPPPFDQDYYKIWPNHSVFLVKKTFGE